MLYKFYIGFNFKMVEGDITFECEHERSFIINNVRKVFTDNGIEAFTFTIGTGYYKGEYETCAIIEVLEAERLYGTKIRKVVETLRDILSQECILLTTQEDIKHEFI